VTLRTEAIGPPETAKPHGQPYPQGGHLDDEDGLEEESRGPSEATSSRPAKGPAEIPVSLGSSELFRRLTGNVLPFDLESSVSRLLASR
jgi:hypothetical protein